jgi:hypothetical protein
MLAQEFKMQQLLSHLLLFQLVGLGSQGRNCRGLISVAHLRGFLRKAFAGGQLPFHFGIDRLTLFRRLEIGTERLSWFGDGPPVAIGGLGFTSRVASIDPVHDLQDRFVVRHSRLGFFEIQTFLGGQHIKGALWSGNLSYPWVAKS